MNQYVAGFMFSLDRTKVALVEKTKFPPGCDWTKNPFNAIGGKIEPLESDYHAMVREFQEETGVLFGGWNHFLELRNDNWTVHFFVAFTDEVFNVKTVEAERIVIRDANDTTAVVPNLRWILPLALNPDRIGAALVFSI